MKKVVSFIIIVVSSLFFGAFTILDDLFVDDPGARQIYEDVALAIIIAVIGVTASKHITDASEKNVLQEVKRMQFDLKQRLETLEKVLKINNTTKDSSFDTSH